MWQSRIVLLLVDTPQCGPYWICDITLHGYRQCRQCIQGGGGGILFKSALYCTTKRLASRSSTRIHCHWTPNFFSLNETVRFVSNNYDDGKGSGMDMT